MKRCNTRARKPREGGDDVSGVVKVVVVGVAVVVVVEAVRASQYGASARGGLALRWVLP